MTFDPTTFSNSILIATAFAAAFIAALWLSLVFWTYRDIRRRSRDPLVPIIATLVVVVLFLPGVLIYLILRPPSTLEEEYQQSLEEEALLQSIENYQVCPKCSKNVQPEWILCPHCQAQLKKRCSACAHFLEIHWTICPYCGVIEKNVQSEKFSFSDNLDILGPQSQGSNFDGSLEN